MFQIRSHVFWFSILLLLTLLLLNIKSIHCQHEDSHVYLHLDSSYYCFRRLNQTHQIGCASNTNGDTGIVRIIRNDHIQEDLDYITTYGDHPPFVPVLNLIQFGNRSLMSILRTSNRVSGILVIEQNTTRPSYFTADRSCPNELFSLYINDTTHGHCRSQQWNSPESNNAYHDGLVFNDFPFPIFLLRNSTQIEILLKKIDQYTNNNWPRLGIELNLEMYAAKDSITCLRRSNIGSRFSLYSSTLCDPLGGNNQLYHTLNLSATNVIPDNSMVVLASRQDSFSMFDMLSSGADSSVTSQIVLLALAEMLHRDPEIRNNLTSQKDRSLMLALFDGEAFDYIGSSDTVYRMTKETFPLTYRSAVDTSLLEKEPKLKISHLSHFIEFNQLAHYGSDGQLNLYLHKDLRSTSQFKELTKTIQSEGQGIVGLNISEIDDGRPLPPSSAQSFLKKRRYDDKFAVMVVTNHHSEYVNKYYNSFLEDGHDMNTDTAQHLTNVATLFARVAYRLVTGKSLTQQKPELQANDTLVRNLLECYLRNSNCKLFNYVHEPEKVDIYSGITKPPYPNYVSVFKAMSIVRQYTYQLLARFTGTIVAHVNSSSECLKLNKPDQQFIFNWQSGETLKGECIVSTNYMMPTVSPAIDYASDPMQVIEANLAEYSIWTESKWQYTSLRIYVMSSPLKQLLILVAGILCLVVSFGVTHYFVQNSTILFEKDQTGPHSVSRNTSRNNEDWPATEGLNVRTNEDNNEQVANSSSPTLEGNS